MSGASLEDELVESGRYLRLETADERSRGTRVVVGFAEGPDGSMVVAAGPSAAWASALAAHPRARITIGTRTFAVDATELEGPAHAAAIRELILRYGTPAERLGSGPAFVLRPVMPAPSDASRRSR